jgi:hypothetical protein
VKHTTLAAATAGAALLLAGCASGAGPQQAAAAAPPSPAASHHRAARPVVTYIVTGSPADVTYGPSGSNHQGSVPLHVTRRLRNPIFYAITVQLSGSGSVTCKIKVNGKVISRAQASGAYQIASCEISRDPLTGRWSDTNSG